MVMVANQEWWDMANREFEKRHGKDGHQKILEMVARIIRPSDRQAEPLTEGDLEATRQLLISG